MFVTNYLCLKPATNKNDCDDVRILRLHASNVVLPVARTSYFRNEQYQFEINGLV